MEQTLRPTRLKKRRQFVLLTQRGEKVALQTMVVQFYPNDSGEVRIGFTVTKRLGNAVVRNRIRRRLREVVRLSQTLSAMGGYDLVVVGRSAALDAPFARLQKEFEELLKKGRALFWGNRKTE